MVRFVRTLQHRTTPQGRDFYALSIPPQVAEALGLKDGGQVAIEVKAVAKGKSEIVLRAGRHKKKGQKNEVYPDTSEVCHEDGQSLRPIDPQGGSPEAPA